MTHCKLFLHRTPALLALALLLAAAPAEARHFKVYG